MIRGFARPSYGFTKRDVHGVIRRPRDAAARGDDLRRNRMNSLSRGRGTTKHHHPCESQLPTTQSLRSSVKPAHIHQDALSRVYCDPTNITICPFRPHRYDACRSRDTFVRNNREPGFKEPRSPVEPHCCFPTAVAGVARTIRPNERSRCATRSLSSSSSHLRSSMICCCSLIASISTGTILP